MLYVVLVHDLKLLPNSFELAVYGDDNVITMHKQGVRCNTIAPHLMRRFNMVYTHYSKADSDIDDTLETIRYLGRKFQMDGAYMRCPLDLKVVLEIPLWIKSKVEISKLVASECDSFFRELSHFGRDIFEQYSEKLFAFTLENAPKYYTVVVGQKLTFQQYIYEMYHKEYNVTTHEEKVGICYNSE
jgi:hypothetical protein